MKASGRARAVWTLVLTVGLVVASCTTQVRGRPLVDTAPAAPPQVRIQAAYSTLPLHFEPNQGQTDEQVKFLSRGSGYTLFLTPTEAVLALTATRRHGDTGIRGYGDTEETVAASTTADAATLGAACCAPTNR